MKPKSAKSLLATIVALFCWSGTSLVLFTSCSSVPAGLDSSSAEEAFKKAEDLQKHDRYEEAIQQFNEVRTKFPYSRFAVMAELKIADVHFERESFPEAQTAYQLFKEFHPKHPQIDYVTFRLGLSYFNQLPSTIDRDLSLSDKAILHFDELLQSYPESTYAKEAQEKKQKLMHMLAEKELYVARFYFRHEVYDNALSRYEYLLKNYPQLGFDAQAMLGAAKSAARQGDGDKSQYWINRLKTEFPNSDEAKAAHSDSELNKHNSNSGLSASTTTVSGILKMKASDRRLSVRHQKQKVAHL